MDSIKIIELSKVDFKNIIEFADEWIGKDYFSIDDLTKIFYLSKNNGLNCSFVAKMGKKIIGIRLSFLPSRLKDSKLSGLSEELWPHQLGEVGYFKSMFISGEFQKQGIGKKLSARSIDVMKKDGAKSILTHCWKESPGNSSFKYLESIKFSIVKEHFKFWMPIDYLCIRCTPKRCECTAIEMLKVIEDKK